MKTYCQTHGYHPLSDVTPDKPNNDCGGFSFVTRKCNTFERHLDKALLDDLRLLKEQMTQKSLQLDSLLGRLSSLENVTSKLLSEKDLLSKEMKTLHTKSASLEGLIGKLDLVDASMLKNLTALLGKVTMLETSLKDVKSTAGKLAASEQRLSTAMRSQNATLRHLNNVNQIWKGNFKIVNTTFSHIRKKVVFPMPAFATTK